ncbi:MAG: sigma-70 family RNA polymerase sigma factor [Verrucomicrobiales bacterium]|nr:sigma-70 family RNA polymerase sigma factor [Verrucomicrobiales bacterium]
MMSEEKNSVSEEEFVMLITRHQAALTGFLCSLLGNRTAGDEVLQETNLVLWKKREDFESGSNFKAWAFKIARFQSLAFLKREKRRPEFTFDEEVLEKLACEAEQVFGVNDDREQALDICLEKLPAEDRELIKEHYFSGVSMADHAEQAGRSIGALRQVLYRIRNSLRLCIGQNMRSQGVEV